MVDVNGAIADWVASILSELGDPDEIHADAEALRRQLAELSELHASAAYQVASTTSWSGLAADAHQDAWDAESAASEHLMATMDAMQAHLDDQGNRNRQIIKMIVGIILEMIEVIAAGYVLMAVFGWLSDLIWIRLAPLVSDIARLLAAFRTSMASFARMMEELGTSAARTSSHLGAAITRVGTVAEKLVVEYAPAYLFRAYPGFLVADALPQLMSGRPVNWKGNAWQVALFAGMDATFNLAWDGLEVTARGAALRRAVTGEPSAADDIPVAPRVPDAPTTRVQDTEGSSGLPSDAPVIESGRDTGVTPGIRSTPPQLILGRSVGRSSAEVPPEPAPTVSGPARTGTPDRPAIEIPLVVRPGNDPAIPSSSTVDLARTTDALPTSRQNPVQASAAQTIRTGESAEGIRPGSAGDRASSSHTPTSGRADNVDHFVAASGRQALLAGIKEGVNTAVGNTALTAVVAKANHTSASSEDYALAFGLSLGMAGARDGFYKYLPYGQSIAHASGNFTWLHRSPPGNAPASQRFVAEIPVAWSYYGVYFVLKDGILQMADGQDHLLTQLTPTTPDLHSAPIKKPDEPRDRGLAD